MTFVIIYCTTIAFDVQAAYLSYIYKIQAHASNSKKETLLDSLG